MGEIWLEKHIYHLRSKYFIHDLLCKDVLNYENQLVSWFSSREDNMLLVHYNDLWDLQQRISKFVGYKVRLPERVLRTKANKLNIEIELITKLKSIERKFIQKNISFYEEISRPRISIRNK